MTHDLDTRLFIESLYGGDMTRRTIVARLLDDARVGSVAGEHGVERRPLLDVLVDESSATGARLREAIAELRRQAPGIAQGHAFPPDLSRATDAALELIGLYANPLTTVAMIFRQPLPRFEEAAKMIRRNVPLTHFASRVLRVLSYEFETQRAALENAANALETMEGQA